MEHTAFRAEDYDAKIRQTLPFYDEFYEQVVDALAISGRKNVSWLDIGCGTGKMYEAASKRISIQEFVFTDISEKMLAAAKARFQSEKNRFKQMSVLELEDIEKYDVVTAIQVHHYLSEKDRRLAVEKCCRALKTGGLFFTFENIAPDSEIGRRIILDRWKAYQIRNGKSREEAESHMKRYGVEYFPLTIEAHLQLMRQCGFQAVELIWMSYMQAGFMGSKKRSSMSDIEQTIGYYDINAKKFSEGTVSVDFAVTQNRFLSKLSAGASILDLGCGSGRDTKFFINHGYKVEAIDGSSELCKLASEHTGIRVKQMLFQELEEVEKYDGIWACSSILHVPSDELADIMRKMVVALKDNGIIYTSFKYGNFEGIKNGRFFTDMTEDTFADMLKGVDGVEIEEQWITSDVRPGRGEEKWLNLILRKK